MPSPSNHDDNALGKRPAPESWGFSPGYFGGNRVTVQTLEQQAGRRSHRRRRSRRHGSEEAGTGRKIWMVVGLIAAVYLGFLAIMMVMPGRPEASAPAAVVAAAPDKTPSAVAAEQHEAPGAMRAAEAISTIKRAEALAEDARRLMRAGQPAAAEKKFADANDLNPNVHTVLMDWATVLRDQQKWVEACDILLKAVMAAPDSATARLGLAGVYYQLKQTNDAMVMAEWALEKDPYSETAHQLLADIATARDQYTKAIEHWKKLVSFGNNPEFRINLGIAYLKTGQNDLALQSFDSAIRINPSNSQAYYYKTIGLIQSGQHDAAADLLSLCVERFGYPFVQAWTLSREFDPLRNHPVFAGLFAESVPAP